MTTTNDFDAAKAIADQLKGLPKEQQQRVLRWVSEHLGLTAVVIAPIDQRSSEASPASGSAAHSQSSQQRSADIKTFVESKRPKNDVQFAAVAAYYHHFEAPVESRQEYIDAKLLQDSARLAGRRRPPRPIVTLNNAKTLGYLDSAGRGRFRINSVGENLVAMTLPGTESVSDRSKGRVTKSRKAKTKAKSKKR
jgi:hypothetical protein